MSRMKSVVLFGVVAALCASVSLEAQGAMPCAAVISPDGSLEVAFENGPDGMFWSLSRKGKPLVTSSRLGLTFALFKVRGTN